MGAYIPGFNIQQEVDVYVTIAGYKPASYVTLEGIRLYNETRFKNRQSPVSPERIIRIPQDAIMSTEQLFRFSSILYEVMKADSPAEGTDYMYESREYCIARNPDCLERLVAASRREDKKEIGLALGYPEDAVSVFGLMVDGQIRNGAYLHSQIMEARRAGMEIPSWVLYLNHIPAELDFVQGHISRESKILAMIHEEFMRKNHPQLAKDYEEYKREMFFS